MYLVNGKYVSRRIDFNKEIYDRLVKISKKYGVPQAVVIRQGIDMALTKIEREGKFILEED